MMKTAYALQREKVVQVFLSDKGVLASEAHSVIPKGYRQATLEEVALGYRHDHGFRQELYDKGWAWTSQEGLQSSGSHELHDDGSFSKIDRDTFYSLPQEKRSYHGPGPGYVTVGVGSSERLRRLIVSADFEASVVALVAYVKAGPSQADHSPTEDSKTVKVADLNELSRTAANVEKILPSLTPHTKSQISSHLTAVKRVLDS
ncbi:MAG: hypothetical protein KGH64_01480 [Candidatus Micrarchaeota archaeon]|nr:hypothetical protein [Candidatus Micrarchaeota archaeon]MDE1833988.1 hypothetical protein [Candidatus Micrarchaeota archaeon]MDE1858961.1 hypothetical protein [Candidatus Micrarchaeota archaeon]